MSEIGVYFHIPFCQHICHYCDFAKTARWQKDSVDLYFKALHSQLVQWIKHFVLPFACKVKSINFGGGTPGLFANHYRPLLAELQPFISKETEISLEANPNNCTLENLQIWSELGFNRLSVGIQTFNQDGLHFLKRDHDTQDGLSAIEQASKYFSNLNVDLIYGWENQTLKLWLNDLKTLLRLPISHCSLYSLTYAKTTPIGRAYLRNKLSGPGDDTLVAMYERACDILSEQGWIHDEVSNWSKPGHECLHNFLYWSQGYYLGLGVGACGFIPTGPYGLRFSMAPKLALFLKQSDDINLIPSILNGIDSQLCHIEQRNGDDWLTEYVGCALRCLRGVDLRRAKDVTGKDFKPRRITADALSRGILQIINNSLLLEEREWIRETSWSLEVLDSFV